ncbi:MAG: cytochrome P450 [Halioglobus sp.]
MNTSTSTTASAGCPAGNESTQAIREALGNFDKRAIRNYRAKAGKPDLSHIPGGKGMPYFGHMYWFVSDVHRWLDKQYEQHGPVFKFNAPGVGDTVFLLGPEANQLVLQNENKLFSNFLAWDTVFATLFDNNLLERDFANHKAHRRILQSAFKRHAIEGHIDIMNPLLKNGIDSWQSGSPIKAMDHLKQLLLETGSAVFLGAKSSDESKPLNKAFSDIVAATTDPLRRKEIWFSPYAKGVRANGVLSDYIAAQLPSRRANEGRDLFSQFCHLRDADGGLFTDEEIRDHVIFLLFAAHDTTTSALSAILFALASNLSWQEELRQEMLDLDKANIEFDDITALTKTGWTLKEALRMYPALSVMPRYALEEFEYAGHKIPANTTVTVSALFSHYMPEFWSNPHTFDPARFSPERTEEKGHQFQYIPFGGGAHKCLGMHFAEVQTKMFLFHLLKHYRVEKQGWQKRYRFNPIPLAFPTDGLPLTFERL